MLVFQPYEIALKYVSSGRVICDTIDKSLTNEKLHPSSTCHLQGIAGHLKPRQAF